MKIAIVVLISLCFVEIVSAEGYYDPRTGKTFSSKYGEAYYIGYTSGARDNNKGDKSVMWEANVHLNQLLCDRPDLRPAYNKRWKSNLAVSEFCPNCGAFSYYHLVDNDGNRKCCRCEAEWHRESSGNYFSNQVTNYVR